MTLVRIAGNNVADVEIINIVASGGVAVASSLDTPGKALTLTFTADLGGTIGTAEIEDLAVTTAKINDGAVEAAKIKAGEIHGYHMADLANVGALDTGTTTGLQIGDSAADLVGFHDKAGTAQRAAAAQAAVAHTVGSAVAHTVSAAVSDTVAGAVAATAATNVAPYGYAEAQANALVANINTIRTDVIAKTVLLNQARVDILALETLLNASRVDILALETLVNELRTTLVNKGIAKGAA